MSKFVSKGNRDGGFVPVWYVVTLLMLFAWNGSLAAAQLRIGDNFLISGASGSDSTPAVAVNPTNGQFLVVWTNNVTTTGTPSISANRVLARLVSPAGALLSEPIVVSRRAAADAALGGSNPSVAYNTIDNEFMVVYDRNYAGSSRGEELSLRPVSGQVNPVIAYDSIANRYMTAWSSDGSAIVGGVLANNGVFLITPTQFSPLGTVSKNPAITFNAQTEQYLLVFEAPSGANTQVFGQIHNGNGLLSVGPIFIATPTGVESSPQALWNNTTNQFLVTWGDKGRNVRSRLVNAGGTLSGDIVRLIGNAAFPRIAYSDQQKRYLLDWVLRNAANANNGFLMGRFVEPDLTTKSASFTTSETSPVEGKPAVAVYQKDSIGLSVWPRDSDGDRTKIAGQLIDLSTVFTGLSLSVTVSPKTVRAGQPLRYAITVKNDGPAPATGVELTDTIPEGAEYVSATPSAGNCAHAVATVTCALGNLAVGRKVTVTLIVTPNQLGTTKNEVVLNWSNNAADASNTTVITKTKVVYPGTLSVVTPNGGETLPAGSSFDVAWELTDGIPGDTLSYKLQYSLNKGSSWKTIDKGITGNSYTWTVPAPAGNRPKSLIRVIGTNSDNDRIGTARSDAPFTVEVLRLDAPLAGTEVRYGDSLDVAWTTRNTRAPVARTVLSYSLNNGQTWKKIAAVEGNPGNFRWAIPQVKKRFPKARVKVVLKSQKGAAVGSVISDRFTILP
ncbi:MAG: Ser-Thr-rich glycosyl-phosphatidyl-inositol-anchored rane family protein [Proteobacteria bacterium]|nr:Ser-Thr-rich glycosyl-phosphatidyl-inositol-anchored rane family protein [Pseudomonadota bacterium]